MNNAAHAHPGFPPIIARLLALLACALAFASMPAVAAMTDLPGGGGGVCGVNVSCPPGDGGGGGVCSLLGTCPPGGGGGGQCTPNPGGPTCTGSGDPPAMMPTSAPNSGAGNPLNVITGNKHQREQDMPALPGVLGLEIVRIYNSSGAGPGWPNNIMGRGWKLSYETHLYATSVNLQVLQADGTRLIFQRDEKNRNQCASDDPSQGLIEIQRTAAGSTYVWTWVDGRRLSFDERGRLTQIQAPTGEFLVLQHDPNGWLMMVTDPQGRSLRINYQDPGKGDRYRGIASIDSPAGRFTYEYGSPLPKGAEPDPKVPVIANLVKASGTGATRHYHYEDARHHSHLTGISVSGTGGDGKPSSQRLVSWAYDDKGRAIRSVKGEPASNVEEVNLEFLDPANSRDHWRTVLTNSLGQKTTYVRGTVGGQFRVMEVRGPGCSSCGESDMRYGYDELGRVNIVTKLSAGGAPLRSTKTYFNREGRVERVTRFHYEAGKPIAKAIEEEVARYEYADGPDGTRTVKQSRASVVEGKRYEMSLRYNGRGQLLSVSERGWASSLDNPSGADGAAQALERTTKYSYAQIGGRSVLVEIDGPLPNGAKGDPGDSDVTRIKYDAKGNFQTEIIAPGNRVLQFAERNAAGHATLFTAGDGINPVRRTKMDYDTRGRLVSVVQLRNTVAEEKPNRFLAWIGWAKEDVTASMPLVDSAVQVSYDLAGRPSRIKHADGTWLQAQYDVAGRLVAVRDQDSNAVNWEWNSENLLVTAIAQSGAGNPRLNRKTQYRYDGANRLAEVIAANGARAQYAYDSHQGLLASATDPINRMAVYEYEHDGRLKSFSQRTGDAGSSTMLQRRPGLHTIVAANGAATTRVFDDFGRVIAVSGSDNGRQVAQYDPAGRIVVLTDPNGNEARYQYDAAGRLVKRSVSGRDSAAKPDTDVVEYKYSGERLVAIANRNQSTEFEYDINGLVVRKVERIHPRGATLPQGQALVFAVKYGYDALARPVSETLASGESLILSYGPNGRPRKVELLSADGKLLRSLATDIDIDPLTGLNAFTHGNGLRTDYSRDGETGRLQTLAVAGKRDQAQAASGFLQLREAHAKENAGGGGTLYSQGIAYDVMGRIISIDRSNAGQVEAKARFGYDPFDYLNEVDAAAEKARWTYDAVGNRVSAANASQSGAGRVQNLSYSPGSNRLREIADGQATIAFEYDAAGNPVRIGARRYVYGIDGRPQQVFNGDKLVVSYAYNARGERMAKTLHKDSGNETTYFLYNGNRVDAEIDENGKLKSQYIYLGQLPLAKLEYTPQQINGPNEGGGWKAWFGFGPKREATRIYAIHSDHLGVPRLATDGQQRVVWRAQYSAFGGATILASNITLNLRFPGQYFDAETGTHYNYFRDYDPQTGRYLTADPLGLAGGVNSYGYVGGDPLRYVDPWGLHRLVMGFEVNHPAAFAGGIHDLNVDYGHAFFYLVDEENKVTSFFSFGPAEQMTAKGQILGVKGTIDYGISEPSKLFSIDINVAQYAIIKAKVEAFRLETKIGSEKFVTALNNTCAESAMEILGTWYLGLGLPDGRSPVKIPHHLISVGDGLGVTQNGVTKVDVTNPYALYRDMVAAGYSHYDIGYALGVLKPGQVDPLVTAGHIK